MSERIDALVIGAGVVGLAVARALAMAGREVVIVESEAGIGSGVSSRNSEVIHAGLYYVPGSLKARLCMRGKVLLYAYCAERRVPHRRCGKLIVAAHPSQHGDLERIAGNARANGVFDLELLTAGQAQRLEPALSCTAALWSPSTGIVDSHALMLALLADAETHGATLALKSAVARGRVERDGISIETIDTDHPSELMRVQASLVVNCAGLNAQRVAASIEGVPRASIPTQRLAKGNYFALAGRAPFSRLVYPVPEPGGLGVHLTLDLGGQAKFGPDVEWLDADAPLDYRVDPARAERFYAAIRRYWPALPDAALAPAYAGVRPKLVESGAPADFVVSGPCDHGVAGLVQLFGIESPGLTSALAIGEAVVAQVTASAIRNTADITPGEAS